jgi:hydroxymethylglutaryl-CoA lyase
VEVGVHLHSKPSTRRQKLAAALNAGCMRFDGALKGIGGCPMAKDELVGNINSEWMIDFFKKEQILQSIDEEALQKCIQIADEIFAS